MKTLRSSPVLCAVVLIAMVSSTLAQDTAGPSLRACNPQARENADQLAKILSISQLVSNARVAHRQIPCGSTATVENLSCFLLGSVNAEGQRQPGAAEQSQLSPHADQVAGILGIKPLVDRAMALSAGRPAGTSMSPEELALRQEISESILEAGFDVDGVLAEIDEERARIIEVRAYLQARRDRGVNLTSFANLITGTGVGIAVNALQFSNSTATVGDGIGVGSGIGSTVLSLIGIKLQRGPAQPLGSAPNMLAVLFGRRPVLYSNYPEDVLAYLNSVPPGEAPDRGTRLQQLMREWIAVGRLDPPDTPKGQKEIDLMTASLDPRQKLRIDDLTNRAMMLADVEGRVSLMKRDLAELTRAVRARHQSQGAKTESPGSPSAPAAPESPTFPIPLKLS